MQLSEDENVLLYEDTIASLKNYIKCLGSPEEIIRMRRKILENGGQGLAAVLAPLVRSSINHWVHRLCTTSIGLSELRETKVLELALRLYLTCAQDDVSLAEELARHLHKHLLQLMKLDSSVYKLEQDRDVVHDMYDMSCEIAHQTSFPIMTPPHTREELLARLPLSFRVESLSATNESAFSGVSISIHQITERQSAQEDVGFVMWPSAMVLSTYLASNPGFVVGTKVMEVGAGCGLTGLAVACIQKDAGAGSVILTDFNDKVLENLKRNVTNNDVSEQCSVLALDFYQQTGTSTCGWVDMQGRKQAKVPVVVAADVICQPSDATALACTLKDVLEPAMGVAYIVCADTEHRFGVDCLEAECRRAGLTVAESSDIEELFEGKLLQMSDLHQTTGYIEGMKLTLFVIRAE